MSTDLRTDGNEALRRLEALLEWVSQSVDKDAPFEDEEEDASWS